MNVIYFGSGLLSKFYEGYKELLKIESKNMPLSNAEEQNAQIAAAQELSRRRYAESRAKYNGYFLECLNDIEALQPSAFSGVQVSRMFTVGVLPKYCKIKDPLTPRQRERVERIIQE